MHYQFKNPNLGGSQETLKTVVLVIQEQPRFKKRVQTQGRSSAPKVMFMKGGGSQNGKPTCATCGKKHYEECLVGTSICFGCGKDGHKVRDCLLLEKKRIRKLILMFQKKMLQQGGISMHSGLEKRSRMRVMMMLVHTCLYIVVILVPFKWGSMSR